MNAEVVMVIGVGGIGLAIARRQGTGRSVLLADFNEATLASAAKALEDVGHNVTARRVDGLRSGAHRSSRTRGGECAPLLDGRTYQRHGRVEHHDDHFPANRETSVTESAALGGPCAGEH
jgi:hypothetical protein